MSKTDKIAELEALCDIYRSVLLKVPHSRGDHTDFCRMKNSGQAPSDSLSCRCHVELVVSTLAMSGPGKH